MTKEKKLRNTNSHNSIGLLSRLVALQQQPAMYMLCLVVQDTRHSKLSHSPPLFTLFTPHLATPLHDNKGPKRIQLSELGSCMLQKLNTRFTAQLPYPPYTKRYLLPKTNQKGMWLGAEAS